MQVLYQPGDGVVSGCCAVTIGAYDGIHLGHRHILELLGEEADKWGCKTAVVTFDRHPATVVRPESAPAILTDLDQKLRLLEEAGVDVALVLRFDEIRARESAEDFVEEVIVGRLNARSVVVGEDFHFGHKRQGNLELLKREGAQAGFDVVGVDLVDAGDGGPAISSTRIRYVLREGAVDVAASLLGRPHQVSGVVVMGDQRGRLLGFPTANLAVASEIAMPADGVYAGWYSRPDGVRLPAAVSLGRRPTFYDKANVSLLEAFLLDWDGDLYDEIGRVEFVSKVRDQEKFDSVDDLVDQMHADVTEIRAILGAERVRTRDQSAGGRQPH